MISCEEKAIKVGKIKLMGNSHEVIDMIDKESMYISNGNSLACMYIVIVASWDIMLIAICVG